MGIKGTAGGSEIGDQSFSKVRLFYLFVVVALSVTLDNHLWSSFLSFVWGFVGVLSMKLEYNLISGQYF